MAPGLCENCNRRPKFGTHRYCGKTCAAQATTKQAVQQPKRPTQSQATAAPKNASRQKGGTPAPPAAPAKRGRLCTYCGQKPTFDSFDYCGKSCAALAGAAQTKPTAPQGAAGAPKTKQRTTRPSNGAPSTSLPAQPHKPTRNKVPIPQVDSSTEEDEEPGEEEEEEEDGRVSTDLDAYPSDSGSESEDESIVPPTAAPKLSAKSAPRGSKPGSGVPRIAPGTCAIPGCGQPSHVDRHGIKTTYCSTKHREEAVKLGLEAGCIMCQRYPQGTSDYFCSSACRNQSMKKT